MLCGKLPFRDDDVDILRLAMQDRLHFHRHVSKGTKRHPKLPEKKIILFLFHMTNNRYIPLIGFVINAWVSLIYPKYMFVLIIVVLRNRKKDTN